MIRTEKFDVSLTILKGFFRRVQYRCTVTQRLNEARDETVTENNENRVTQILNELRCETITLIVNHETIQIRETSFFYNYLIS